jgi:hypothetical protein
MPDVLDNSRWGGLNSSVDVFNRGLGKSVLTVRSQCSEEQILLSDMITLLINNFAG